MSNKIRSAGKRDKAPAVRRNEFSNTIHQLEQKIYQLHMALVENIYLTRYASSGMNNLVKFLTQKGIIVEEEYKKFVEEQNKKIKLAEEIRKDETLSREEKVAKAEEQDIPEEWVVEPEVPSQTEQQEAEKAVA